MTQFRVTEETESQTPIYRGRAALGGCFSLDQWHLAKGDIIPQETSGNVWRHFRSSLGKGAATDVVGRGRETADHPAMLGASLSRGLQ